jgi:membrane protease YdiL (CAAX protease family)
MLDTPPHQASQTKLIAPLWHTLLVIAAVLTVSTLGLRMKTHTAALTTHHVREYLFTLGYEWVLASAVLWGLWLRGTDWRTLLGDWQQTAKAWREDFLIAILFWVAAAFVLAAVGALLRLTHLSLPERTVSALAPRDAAELILFLGLSLSAGFCEELLFRGYFHQQFAHLAKGRVWAGIAVSAVLFGMAHLYEGAAGVISIAIFGLMFSLLALKRRSLRPGMIAHAWHDSFSGLILFLLQRAHVLS